MPFKQIKGYVPYRAPFPGLAPGVVINPDSLIAWTGDSCLGQIIIHLSGQNQADSAEKHTD